jgi:hypothetical protein
MREFKILTFKSINRILLLFFNKMSLINCLKSHLKPKKEVVADLYEQVKLRVTLQPRLQQLSQIYLKMTVRQVL